MCVCVCQVELGVSSDDLCRMLRAFPALLRLSVEDEMRPCVQFLRDVGIGNVARILVWRAPCLLRCIYVYIQIMRCIDR